jgi:hypothetical protein
MKEFAFVDTTHITLEEKSYIYGLLLSDGSVSIRNQETYTGFVRLEVSKRDEDIVDKLCKIVPYSTKLERTRNTNFLENYHSISFLISRQYFIKNLIDWGFPIENKTINAKPPIIEYDRNAFWRGVLDGDGSLGIRHNSKGKSKAYLSLTTKSESLKEEFCEYLRSITGHKYNPKRNKRDNIYNIGCGGHAACKVLKEIYRDCTIYLNRKHENYLECLQWEKENSIPKRNISGVIGVGIDRNRGKWMSYIMIDKKNIDLGRYDDKIDAIIARLKAEKEYFGDFALQKHLFKEYGLE